MKYQTPIAPSAKQLSISKIQISKLVAGACLGQLEQLEHSVLPRLEGVV